MVLATLDAAGPPRAEVTNVSWLWWGAWLAVFFGAFPGIVAYLVWAERKVAARFQDRIGPNRVGPLGLLQPIADAIKLLTKEDLVPRSADKFVHLLAPVVLLVSAFLGLAVIPFGIASATTVVPFGVIDPASTPERWFPGLAAIDLPSGLLYLVAASSLSALGIFLAGWASRNKYSLLGAMRGVAQLVSYEIPQVVSLVPVVLWAGSLSLTAIFNRQLDQGWFLFSPPGIVGFVILLIASVAEVNRAPFDLPEAESEIIAGFHTEYSSMRFGLFFLAEYLSVFAVSCVATALFLGGGTLPFTTFPLRMVEEGDFPLILANLMLIGIFTIKVLALVFLMFWVRATLPRMRVDRLMAFAWKVLIPLSLVNLLAAAVWYELAVRPGTRGGWWLGWAVLTPVMALAFFGIVRLGRDTKTVPSLQRPAAVRPIARRGRGEAGLTGVAR